MTDDVELDTPTEADKAEAQAVLDNPAYLEGDPDETKDEPIEEED